MGRLNESRMSATITDEFAATASVSMGLSLHARHGTGVHIGLDSDVTVREPGRPAQRGRIVIVPPDALHTAVCPGPCLSLLYDPELVPELKLSARERRGAFLLDGNPAAKLSAAVTAHRAALTSPEVLRGLSREAQRWLAKDAPRRHPD